MEGNKSPLPPHKEEKMKRSKRHIANLEQIEKSKLYSLEEAREINIMEIKKILIRRLEQYKDNYLL